MPLSRHSVGGNELTRNSSKNTQLQSSQLAELLWTDPGLMSGISVRELISTLNNFFLTSAGGELMVKHSPKILASEEKATTTIIPKEDEVHNKKISFQGQGN